MDLSLVVNGLAGVLNEGLAQSERGGGLSRRGFLRVAITGGAAASVVPGQRGGPWLRRKGIFRIANWAARE
jgi:hypothetical protein